MGANQKDAEVKLEEVKTLLQSNPSIEQNRFETLFWKSSNFVSYAPITLYLIAALILVVTLRLDFGGYAVGIFQRSGSLLVCVALIFAFWRPANAMFLKNAEDVINKSEESIAILSRSINLLNEVVLSNPNVQIKFEGGVPIEHLIQKLETSLKLTSECNEKSVDVRKTYIAIEAEQSGQLLLAELLVALVGTFVWGFGDILVSLISKSVP